MTKPKILIMAFMGLVLVACAKEVKPVLTPIEKQQIQSRTYDGTIDREDLFNAVVTVFQDKGYIIENAHLATGIVTATSETENNTTGWQTLTGITSKAKTKVTATVQKYGKGSRVRLNFLNISNTTQKTCNAWGFCNTSQDSSDKVVYGDAVYTSIFNAIDDAIFVLGAGGTEVTR